MLKQNYYCEGTLSCPSVLLAVEVLSAHVARGRAESGSHSSCCLPLVAGKYEKLVVWSVSE